MTRNGTDGDAKPRAAVSGAWMEERRWRTVISMAGAGGAIDGERELFAMSWPDELTRTVYANEEQCGRGSLYNVEIYSTGEEHDTVLGLMWNGVPF